MKIYFHNVGKNSSFALNNNFFFFALFGVHILLSNDIIKLIDYIKLTRDNYLNIIFFLKKNIYLFFIFYYAKTKIDPHHSMSYLISV
jgi:hypothetical protein